MTKAYVKIKSDGKGQNTHVFLVDKDGRKHELPRVHSVTWHATRTGVQAVIVLDHVKVDVGANPLPDQVTILEGTLAATALAQLSDDE